MMPLISLVIPVYNGEKYIRECIDSVLDQDYNSVEIVVVDDGSDDETPKIVSEYPTVRYFKQPRSGANVARNLGIQKAGGEFIKFLDADDLLVKGCLSKQLHFALQQDKTTIGYGYYESFDGSGRGLVNKRVNNTTHQNQIVELILRNILTTLPLHRTAALKEIGGFDERLKSRQEWNMHIRLAQQGYKFLYDGIFVYRQREHSDPLRINNRRFVPEIEMSNIEFAFDSIKDTGDQDVLDAWAGYVWGIGRQFILRGDHDGAGMFFSRAKTISPKGYRRFLSKKYRLLASVIGPIAADNLFKALREKFKNVFGKIIYSC